MKTTTMMMMTADDEDDDEAIDDDRSPSPRKLPAWHGEHAIVFTLGQRLARRATARTSDPVLPWWQATYRDSQDGNSATGVVMETSSATGATMTATE